MDTTVYKISEDAQIDDGIRSIVATLRKSGVETFESCQGGAGHTYVEPTVRFHGDRSEGMRALASALRSGLPVVDLRRVWPVVDGEMTGPWWEMTFRPTCRVVRIQRKAAYLRFLVARSLSRYSGAT